MPTAEELPPDVQERLERLEELERKDAERRGDYDENLRKVEHRAKIEMAERDAYNKMLEGALLQAAAKAAIGGAKGNVEALLPHVIPHLSIVAAKGGRGFAIMVRDPEQQGHIRDNLRTGRPMTVDDLVSEMREHPSLGSLFEGAEDRSAFRGADAGIVRLNAADSKDPKVYQRLKERQARGEIKEVWDDKGRRLM